ncbi:RNA polymerase II-associated protein 1 [Larimichthys crocea]|uniref:Uncharacterized protein n=1 Tax=Larimichthys crocea TaxID=215358 RepID=A0ACD3RSA6_LARCR|nr:RNA polymerase II-associated protein 1 [Larimichthys crocea]
MIPEGALQAGTHCLQWLLLLEVWREDALKVILPVAKLARLSCVFLCSSDLFLERPVQKLTWGLASFQDLYSALLTQYEAVSFGDRLFGCWVLLPLQRRYSVTMRLAVFGEHVGILRSLGVTLEQEVEAARHSMLRKIYYLTDEVLRNHLLLFRLPQQHSEFGFDTYEQLPPIREKRLESVLRLHDGGSDKGD